VIEEGTLLAKKYRLTRPAGFGGMAQLWVATNQATGAEVCIKILVPEQSDDESVERFRREAHAAARLSHRAIVRIFDLVELGPTGEATTARPAALAIVMELLHGETLGDFLMKRGKVDLEEAIDLTMPFLSALAHAHRAGVVHRDLKPDNIFLATDPDGHVIPKVLDFGVSKMAGAGDQGGRSGDSRPLTLDGVLLGTPSFMSPEQMRGARDVDARSDVFSAGILFYMMLAGKNPFESESFHSVVSAVIQREVPRPPGLTDPLWEVLDKALAKDPNERFADATELGFAFRRASGRASTTDSGPHSASALPPSMRKAVVPPLGGDSHVTVPPVGNAELGDASPEVPARAAMPAARRRAVRIVAGVLAASLAITVAALFRGPTGSSGSASGSGSASTGTSTSTSTSAGASAGASTASDVVAGGSGSVGTSTTTTTSTSTSTSTSTTTTTTTNVVAPGAGDAGAGKGSGFGGGATTKKKGLPAPHAPFKERSIVRDPGF
jgi:serine/threonine-protein kinase